MLVTGVFRHKDHAHLRVFLSNLIQQPHDGQRVDLLRGVDAGELLVVAVDGSENVVALPAG